MFSNAEVRIKTLFLANDKGVTLGIIVMLFSRRHEKLSGLTGFIGDGKQK